MTHLGVVRVSFNPARLKQVDEAKTKYIQARQEGRIITDLDGKELDTFPIGADGFIITEKVMPENYLATRFFDETGDRRIFWDINSPNQIKEAHDLFQQYMDRGWKAYAMARDGDKGRRIFQFDGIQGEIWFDDKGTKERLKDFAAKFREVRVLPKTWPG